MELKQLEYFLAVSNTKSFTRAAEQLYVSQPSVTAAIKKLEDELGIVLFDRSKKQAALTSEGLIFYHHAGIVMQDISKAAQKAAELKNLTSGNIQIGISPFTGRSVVAYLLAKFHSLFPALQFTLVEDSSEQLRQKLDGGILDLAFLPVTDIISNKMENITCAIIAKESLSVYLPSFHLLTRKSSISLSELKQELLLLPNESCWYRTIINHCFETLQQKPHVAFSSNYPQFLSYLIIAGSGVAILPEQSIESANIKEIPLQNSPEIQLVIAKKSSRTIAHAAEKLYGFLQESYVE